MWECEPDDSEEIEGIDDPIIRDEIRRHEGIEDLEEEDPSSDDFNPFISWREEYKEDMSIRRDEDIEDLEEE